MKASKELDALVAEKVMGWENVWQPFFPSTEISDAWQVVEKFELLAISKAKNGYGIVIRVNHETDRELDRFFESKAETAPLAICIASLRLKGIDIDENNKN